jgi:ribonuclease HII
VAITPTLELERELFGSGVRLLGGVDEVGRGAIAGPVTVGVAVIDATISDVPKGLRDSKLMSKAARERMVPVTKEWVLDYAIGSATADEIDHIGIVAALRLAWTRAYSKLELKPDHVILDGKHNWIAVPKSDLFDQQLGAIDIPVTMKIKGDAHCGVVAAASVLAKVARDNYMVEIAAKHPEFGWDSNAGYGAAIHMDAIRQLGPTPFHRTSWNLPSGPAE